MISGDDMGESPPGLPPPLSGVGALDAAGKSKKKNSHHLQNTRGHHRSSSSSTSSSRRQRHQGEAEELDATPPSPKSPIASPRLANSDSAFASSPSSTTGKPSSSRKSSSALKRSKKKQPSSANSSPASSPRHASAKSSASGPIHSSSTPTSPLSPRRRHHDSRSPRRRHGTASSSATAAAATTTNICTSNDSKTFYPSDSTQSRGCPSGSKTCPHSRDQQAAGEDKPLDSTDHRVHRVTPTDTLRRLSMMYDVSVSEICQLNELSSRHESALRARATVFIPRKANNAAPQSPPPSEASRRRSAVAWLMDAATVPTEEARFYLDANDWNTRRAYAHLKSDKEFAQRNRRFGATSASLRC
mmetsp:Transcript_4634/g.11473  ORF Transcript_4634/g.11473 Transcript_4634/m.11473 type:complete len:359 (-) Transcript_4634:166-1242(-)